MQPALPDLLPTTPDRARSSWAVPGPDGVCTWSYSGQPRRDVVAGSAEAPAQIHIASPCASLEEAGVTLQTEDACVSLDGGVLFLQPGSGMLRWGRQELTFAYVSFIGIGPPARIA